MVTGAGYGTRKDGNSWISAQALLSMPSVMLTPTLQRSVGSKPQIRRSIDTSDATRYCTSKRRRSFTSQISITTSGLQSLQSSLSRLPPQKAASVSLLVHPQPLPEPRCSLPILGLRQMKAHSRSLVKSEKTGGFKLREGNFMIQHVPRRGSSVSKIHSMAAVWAHSASRPQKNIRHRSDH